MALQYSTPSIKHDEVKPEAFSNQSYRYSQLSDHWRFEELVYSIYRQEINGGSWSGMYDQIQLLQGVRDRGRDCILHRNRIATGVIQCKHSIHSDEAVNKPECIREIIKFVLHSIIDPTILPDVKSFTYYFAVSHAFNEPAKLLLADFKTAIIKEEGSDIQKWTQTVLTSNDGLRGLVCAEVSGKLMKILTGLTVVPIVPQELDLLLNKSSNVNVVRTFFEYKSVLDPEAFQPMIDKAIEKVLEYKEVSSVPISKIQQSFRESSFHLLNSSHEFEGLPGSHIRRKESTALMDWILQPLAENNESHESEMAIALLVGGAGTGKTVILKELLEDLEHTGIPTLGIKADRIYADSIRSLEAKMDLQDSLTKMILKLQMDFDKVVILIDQIDALSQSVSIDRQYLDTFNQLVRKLSTLDGVRIIISCRIYDLEYDQDLKYYQHQKIFTVGSLEKEDVKKVISQLNPDLALKESLLELLLIPNHLNVFCKIYQPVLKFDEIKSLTDLYHVLWEQKINQTPYTARLGEGDCKKLILSLATKMYNEQRIVVSKTSFQGDHAKALAYLKSNGLVIEEQGELTFFHQTFYDYAFAKGFIESGKKVISYLTDNRQALHIRASLKMIINFLRESNFNAYIRFYEEILFTGNNSKKTLTTSRFRVHTKLLVLELLGRQQYPMRGELILASKILKHRVYRSIFLDFISTPAWFDYCLQNNVLDELIPQSGVISTRVRKSVGHKAAHAKLVQENLNQCFRILMRFMRTEHKQVLNFMANMKEFESKDEFVSRLLAYLKIWDTPTAFQLFDRYEGALILTKYWHYQILKTICEYNPLWALERYQSILMQRLEQITIPQNLYRVEFNHDDEEMFKALFEAAPEQTVNSILNIIEMLVQKTRNDHHDGILETDFAFHMFDHEDRQNPNDQNTLLHMLVNRIRALSNANIPWVDNVVFKHLESNSETLLTIVLYAMVQNPERYSVNFFQLTSLLIDKGAFERDSRINYVFRQALTACYPYLTHSQKQSLNEFILSLRFEREDEVFFRHGKRKHNLKFRGQTKLYYLQAIPERERSADSVLKKVYAELMRKFPEPSDRYAPRSGSGMVGPPLDRRAYPHMNLEQWEESIRKYNKSFQQNFWTLKGSILEHSREFETIVTRKPAYFAPFIEKLIGDRSFDMTYAIHGMNGLKAARYEVSEFKRLYKILIRQELDTNETRYVIWMADYLIDTRATDREIVTYFCTLGTTHPDPDRDKDSKNAELHGKNTVRGAVADILPYLWYQSEERLLIFGALRRLVSDPVACVRSAAIRHLAYLMNTDEPETLRIFLEATAKPDDAIYRSSPWTANWLAMRNFPAMKNYFMHALNMEPITDNIAFILGNAWLLNQSESKPLLERVLKSSNKAKSRMIDLSLHFISDKKLTTRKKATALFKRYLNNRSSEVTLAYASAFFELTEENFPVLFPLLKFYSKSVAGRSAPNQFFIYLAKCAKQYPKECLLLLEIFRKHEKPKNTEPAEMEDARVKALLAAYNSLKHTSQLNNHLLSQSMKLFDTFLLDKRFHRGAQQALEKIEL